MIYPSPAKFRNYMFRFTKQKIHSAFFVTPLQNYFYFKKAVKQGYIVKHFNLSKYRNKKVWMFSDIWITYYKEYLKNEENIC